MIIEERIAKINEITLKSGKHTPGGEMCAMELAAWIAGEEHSDHPKCVDPIIAQFLRSWNDSLDDADRQKLKPYVLKSLNTRATRDLEQRRGLLAADWVIRVFTPTWLNLANLGKEAEALRSLPEIKSWADVVAAKPRLEEAERAGYAARDAARDAAWPAEGAAALDAALDAARDAARDAAWPAEGAAAWPAEGAAAWSAARSAAWSAASSAASSAEGAAALDAALDAARKALSGTVDRLQASAFELLDRMIAVTEDK